MNVELSAEAQEFGRHARRAFGAAGGDRLVQDAEREALRREELVAGALTDLGALDLDPRGSPDELQAAAALCRSAGWCALPYPLAERLAGVVVVDSAAPAAAVEGLTGPWIAVTLDGVRSLATPRPPTQPARKTGFVVDVDLDPLEGDGSADVALGLVLPCWTLLGMLDRAIDLTAEHVRHREQFGQPLASFQGVQFQLTDAEVERAGLEIVAAHALWSVAGAGDDPVADALALRLAAVEAAEVVFRVTHQLHGAIGFCDEAFLSWLSRHSQPLRRLPFGPTATRQALARRIGRRGLSGLFDDPAAL